MSSGVETSAWRIGLNFADYKGEAITSTEPLISLISPPRSYHLD